MKSSKIPSPVCAHREVGRNNFFLSGFPPGTSTGNGALTTAIKPSSHIEEPSKDSQPMNNRGICGGARGKPISENPISEMWLESLGLCLITTGAEMNHETEPKPDIVAQVFGISEAVEPAKLQVDVVFKFLVCKLPCRNCRIYRSNRFF